jgi:hypothetical protein
LCVILNSTMTRPKRSLAALCLLLVASLACASLPSFITRTTPTPSPAASAASATPAGASTEAAPTGAGASPTATARATAEATRPAGTPGTGTPEGTVAPEVSLVKQTDGSTLVVDDAGGYQLTLPPKWLTLALGEEDMQSILTLAMAQYPEEANLIEAFTASSAKTRAFAFDLTPSHVKDDITPAIIVAYDPGSAPIALNLLVQSTVRLVPQAVDGAEILNSDVGENAGGLPIGIVEAQVPLKRDTGEPATIYEKVVLFKTPGAAVLVTLAVIDDYKATLVPIFDSVVDTIQVSGQ